MELLKALKLIHAVPEVERHLVDELSRKVFEVRMEYAIYPDIDSLWANISKVNINWSYPKYFSKLEDAFDKNEIENIVIFGAGEWGRYTLSVLKRSKYKNLNIIICDNDSKKWKIGGGYNKS